MWVFVVYIYIECVSSVIVSFFFPPFKGRYLQFLFFIIDIKIAKNKKSMIDRNQSRVSS